MLNFAEHMRNAASTALRSLDEADRADVYAVSFWVDSEDEDARLTTLTVGTNTESHVRETKLSGEDEQEVRWNYAYWLQNSLAVIGEDPTGAHLRRSWLQEQGLWYEGNTDIDEAIVELCVTTVQWLHSSGVIEAVFGRPIPVIIHELEYYDQIATQNVEANGPELVSGLVEWISSLYEEPD
jgi:hypothetical protein